MQTASLQQAEPSREPSEAAVSAYSLSAASNSFDDSSLSAIVSSLSHSSAYSGRKAQSSLTSYVTRPASVSRLTRLNDFMLKMIVGNFQPFSVVEDKGFHEFVNVLNPFYIIPSGQLLPGDLLLSKYKMALASAEAILAKAESVCLITDSWTSINTEDYIAGTA